MVSRYIRSNILGFIAIFIAVGGVGGDARLKHSDVPSATRRDPADRLIFAALATLGGLAGLGFLARWLNW